MSNLVAYNEMQQMAEAMARSQLFGMKTPDQVVALMLVAQANGQHPAAAARDYDIISGRPSKKAEAILRDITQALLVELRRLIAADKIDRRTR